MKRAGVIFAVLALTLVVLVALLFPGDRPHGAAGTPIVMFCAIVVLVVVRSWGHRREIL